MSQHRSYCFTLNNYEQSEIDVIKNMKSIKYLIIGKEVGKEGTKHLQGFVAFKSTKRFDFMKKVNPRWHLEAAKGTPHQNFLYCSKDGDFEEIGTRPEEVAQGKRNDMESIKKKVLKGTRVRDLLVNGKIVNNQQLRFAENLQKYYQLNELRKVDVYWFHGPPGTGKTRTAYNECVRDFEDNFWISNGDFTFLEGYTGQRAVIFDDLRVDSVQFNRLLQLLDVYPIRVNIKGASVAWNVRRIYITSPYKPQYLYEHNENVKQLIRRVKEVREFIFPYAEEAASEVGGNTIPLPSDNSASQVDISKNNIIEVDDDESIITIDDERYADYRGRDADNRAVFENGIVVDDDDDTIIINQERDDIVDIVDMMDEEK